MNPLAHFATPLCFMDIPDLSSRFEIESQITGGGDSKPGNTLPPPNNHKKSGDFNHPNVQPKVTPSVLELRSLGGGRDTWRRSRGAIN